MNTYALIRVTHPEHSTSAEQRIVDKCEAGSMTQATRKLLRANKLMPVSVLSEGYKVVHHIPNKPKDTNHV